MKDSQLIGIDQAITYVESDKCVTTATAACELQLLSMHLHRRKKEFEDVRVCCANPSQMIDCSFWKELQLLPYNLKRMYF